MATLDPIAYTKFISRHSHLMSSISEEVSLVENQQGELILTERSVCRLRPCLQRLGRDLKDVGITPFAERFPAPRSYPTRRTAHQPNHTHRPPPTSYVRPREDAPRGEGARGNGFTALEYDPYSNSRSALPRYVYLLRYFVITVPRTEMGNTF